MIDSDVWSVVFVGWKSKAEEVFGAVSAGQVDAWVGKLHVRKGARFLAVLEDGTVLGAGTVVSVAGNRHELSLDVVVPELAAAPVLRDDLKQRVAAIPKGFLKGPVTSIIVMPGKKDGGLDEDWFREAVSSLGKTPVSTPQCSEAAPISAPKVPKVPKKKPEDALQPPAEDEREALLKGWIPPVLQGLLAEHVRADQWELMVAYALRALGCQVKYMGKAAGAKAVPDCVARYTSPTGQIIELVVDAKAGQWNGAVDDIRAMRDYLEVATPYAYPLFVANSLTKDVPERLRQHVMHGKVARAICGRDLAHLVTQRLTDPNFNVEFELRRFFL